MTAGRVIRSILFAAWFAGMGISFFESQPASGELPTLSRVPDPATGHIIPMEIRGTGTIYITEEDWDKYKPYWYFLNFSTLSAFIIVPAGIAYKYLKKKNLLERTRCGFAAADDNRCL